MVLTTTSCSVLTACREYDQLAQANVEVFFTPLKFVLEWWQEVRGYVSTSRMRVEMLRNHIGHQRFSTSRWCYARPTSFPWSEVAQP